MKKFLGQLLSWAMVLGIIGLGVAGLQWSISEIRLSGQSRSWPQAYGRIISSQVCIARHSKGTNYWPQVQYEYSVGGKHYQNDTIIFGQNGSARQPDAEATVAKFYVNRQVKVYYNPNSPSVSCLEPGQIYWATYLAIPLCAMFVLFGLFLMLFWWATDQLQIGFGKKRRRKSKYRLSDS